MWRRRLERAERREEREEKAEEEELFFLNCGPPFFSHK